MATLTTSDNVILKVGNHYFREDRKDQCLLLNDPQELICTRILKGSAEFTTTDYEEIEDEFEDGVFYITGERFCFKRNYILDHLHSSKKKAIQASILQLECETIHLHNIIKDLEELCKN